MKTVSIFGLGYVGAVTAGCLARDGLQVVGVDQNEEKVAMVREGESPIIEPGLTELLQQAVKFGRLATTTSASEAVRKSEVSFVTVGTPSRSDGALDLTYVNRVCEEIGDAIAEKKKPHTVVIRSTVLPGTTERCAKILRKRAGRVKVNVAFNPEFLREGTAIRDYDTPAYTVIGTDDPAAEAHLRQIYASVEAPVLVVKAGEAELVKYAANGWHATKISFANEIGRVAKHVGLDGRRVMNILVQDTKLNTSSAYMRPGFAYGGSCLPKDVRALSYLGRTENISLPLFESLARSNESHVEFALCQVLESGARRVGLLGLAFKSGTDDLRESPAVELAERLIGKGCRLSILDHAVREASLIGANRLYIEEKLPHLSSLLAKDANELLEKSDVVVVTHGGAEFRDVIDRIGPDVPILDLAGIFQVQPDGKSYSGIAW